MLTLCLVAIGGTYPDVCVPLAGWSASRPALELHFLGYTEAAAARAQQKADSNRHVQ